MSGTSGIAPAAKGNLEDALVVATFLNSFVNHSHIIKIANMAQLVNVIAPIFASDKGLFLQTIYYPLQLFANNSKGKSLELFVDSPKYASKRFGDVPYLDMSAAYDNGALFSNTTSYVSNYVLASNSPTVRTASTSPQEASSISVTLTGSRAPSCCRTGSTTVLLVHPSTAPTASAVVSGMPRPL